MKLEQLRPCLRFLAPTSNTFAKGSQARGLHQRTKRQASVPEPIPFAPDVPTFLSLIGRGLSRYANKFPSWESLFSLTGTELKQLGIEPTRKRRYLLHWMDKYRKGNLGPGSDFRYVTNGEAILKIAKPIGPGAHKAFAKYVVNVPHPEAEPLQEADLQLVRPVGYNVRGNASIRGPYAVPITGDGAVKVKAVEGMWEDKQGRKIDGGERRRTETQFRKRSAARRAEREAELLAKL